MTAAERRGLERTLKLLHLLGRFGILEQRMCSDGIRWFARRGAKKRLAALVAALR